MPSNPPSQAQTGPPADDGLDPAGTTSASAAFSSPRKLHPASILAGVPLGQLIQSLIFPAAAIFATAGRFTLVALGVLVLGGFVVRILHWHRFRFSFDGAVVRVDSGVLARHHRSVDVDRIQQVELDRPALQRALGVATIRIETAGRSNEPDIELRVLDLAAAQAFRAAVRRSKQHRSGDTADTPSQPVLHIPLFRVVVSSVTGAQLLVLPTVLGALFGAALQMIGDQLAAIISAAQEFADDTGLLATLLERRLAATLGALAVLVVLAVLTAVIVGVFRDGNFHIDNNGGDLVIRRGIVGTRDSTVPRARIQRVEVLANPLRRLLGLATVRISSAGGGSGGTSRVTMPALPVTEAHALVHELLGVALPLDQLQNHPRAALRRALWRWGRLATLLVAAVTVIAGRTGWPGPPTTTLVMSAAIAATAVVFTARTDYRMLSHALTDAVVIARHGPFIETVSVAPLTKVQATSTTASWFQRRLDVGNLTAHVAGPGGDVTVRDAGADTLARAHETLRTAAASPWSVGQSITPPV